MPLAYHAGTFEKQKTRWVKMHAGTRYRVTCEDLGLPQEQWTREGSRVAANHWWAGILSKLDTRRADLATIMADLPPSPRIIDPASVARYPTVPPLLAPAVNAAAELLDYTIPLSQRQRLADELAAGAGLDTNTPVLTIREHLAAWLKAERREVKPSTWGEVQLAAKDLPFADTPTSRITEAAVTQYRDYLDGLAITPLTRKHRATIIKRFFTYLWKHRAIELPRNLEDLSFKTSPKKVTTYPLPVVKETLASLPPRLKGWALLCLNTGMSQADLAELSPDMVQGNKLTRKRVKTEGHETVPTVEYRLWPETIAAMGKPASKTHWFLSQTGTPLKTQRIEDGKVKIKDLCKLAWKRAKVPVQLKHWRTIAATLLESHKDHGRQVPYFLGHSPKTLAAKHYAAPSPELLAEATDWIRSQIFPKIK